MACRVDARCAEEMVVAGGIGMTPLGRCILHLGDECSAGVASSMRRMAPTWVASFQREMIGTVVDVASYVQ